MEYTITFEVPDNIIGDSLFNQRETSFYRFPYELEKKVLQFVYEGQPEEMVSFCQDLLLTSLFKLPIGKTSNDTIHLLKYLAVSAITLACRAAIEGGVVEAVAYSKSDDEILQVDSKSNPKDILFALARAVIGYAELVKQSRAQRGYSAAIRGCIEYINVHLHENITLDALAAGTPYSKEYLARLFKNEVKIPVSDYVLQSKIKEAKDLLKKGRTCSEVAQILGFSSQSYFIRQFKKETGMPPGKYLAETVS